MAYGFTADGLTIPTISEIETELADEYRAKIDPALDLSADQPFGQAVSIAAEREAILWELLQTVVNMLNPNAAEGFMLDNSCALSGTTRGPAKKSTVTLSCNVNNGFTAVQGAMMANVAGAGNEQIRFVNKAAVGPLTPAGVYPIEFEAVEYGPVVANSGTLTVITAPVSGWNSCTNADDAELGSLEEEDTDLRVRREDEITAVGASTVDAIRADVLQVPGVRQCFVFENVTLTTDADGVPGKAFEVVIYDGNTPEAANLDVAQAIWNAHPSGAEMYGTTSQNVVDATGTTRTVKFSRATVKNIYLTFESVVVNAEDFPADGIAAIKDAVVAYATRKQNLGVDVIAVGMKAAALAVPGVIDVPTLKLGLSASPSGTANLVITGREIADVDTSRIVVSTIEGDP